MYTETQHPSHGDKHLDGVLRLEYAAGRSFADLAKEHGLTRERVRSRVMLAKARGYDFVGVGRSLPVRGVNYVVDHLPARCRRITTRPDGFRVLDLIPAAVGDELRYERCGVRPRFVDLDVIRIWAGAVNLMLEKNKDTP